jgi:DNA repair protein RadC
MYNSRSLFELNNQDRPRERLLTFGSSVLSNVELLAIILRSGGRNASVLQLSSNLLRDFSGFKGLQEADFNSLIKYPDVGIAKAAGIKAACEIGLRLSMQTSFSRSIISTPADIYNSIRKRIFGLSKEHLYVLSLNSRMHVNSIDLISIGTVNQTLVHPREVFKVAVLKDAVYIVLVHNHPSNDTSPSNEDIVLTSEIFEAGKTLGIKLLDHVIACDTTYTSLRRLGCMDSYKSVTKGGDYDEKDDLSI